MEGPSGHDPRDARLERLRQDTMRRYGVAKIEDLPIDFNGVAFLHGEALSTAIYRRHFAALYDGYDRQAQIQRALALDSPVQAIRPWSAAMAPSDPQGQRANIVALVSTRFLNGCLRISLNGSQQPERSCPHSRIGVVRQ